MVLERLQNPKIYLGWVALTTVVGTLIEFFAADNPDKFITIPLVWFFALGVVPAFAVFLLVKIAWFVKNRGQAKEILKGRKRYLLVAVAVFLVVIIAINWLFYNMAGFFLWDIFTTQPLSEEEVRAKAGTFTRNYPDVVKGVWEPNAYHMEKMLLRDSDRLKEMGVNTLSVAINYEFNKDGTLLIRDEHRSLSNLVRAKEEGFAIFLTPSLGKETLYDFDKEGVEITKEEYLAICEEISVKWAELAEEYQVEYISPVSEFDGIVQMNFAGKVPWGERFPETAIVVGEWHKRVLPKMRDVFTGKISTKFGYVYPDLVARADDFAGYDIIGTASTHDNYGLDHARKSIKDVFNHTATIAEETNSGWAVLEAWMPIGGPFWPTSVNEDGESLDILQDDYYRISTEEYLKRDGGAGYIFHSWTMPISPVKGRPAEQVLTDFFNQI
jgi:hypothetical protein